MFRSATFRLTLSYLAVIMTISLLFSAVVYGLSMQELASSYRRETVVYRLAPNLNLRLSDGWTNGSPDELYAAAQQRLVWRLGGVNLGILVAAGVISLWLARRTLRPIEAALQAQSRFAADASHELRTPLTAMKSEIEVALRAKKLADADARALLVSNLEEINKLEQLSTGLLKLAQQEGALARTEPCATTEIIDAATGRLKLALERRNITVRRDIASGLEIAGDFDSLVELCYILLDNAVKYGPQGSDVMVAAVRRADFIELTVTDQGSGIAAADLPHIFERFYRADNSRSKNDTPGYGLGLSIARQIVDLHRGEIEATSPAGSGARFAVRLPAA